MNWTLELVPIPVTDVARAKSFYADQLGFAVDHDTTVSDEIRIVQLTPPGSRAGRAWGRGRQVQVSPLTGRARPGRTTP